MEFEPKSGTRFPQIAEVLGPQGPMAKRMPEYEHRPQQLAMADAVAEALDDPHHLIVEAGAGVGKSFAYLVPVIQRIAQTRQRVVVSTHTIALQEQLLNKDLPLLSAVMEEEFSAVLMKGRHNYVGLRRLELAGDRRQLLFDSRRNLNELQRIDHWARHTTDGTLSDLEPAVDVAVWNHTKSEHGNCMGRRCRYYKPCFYQQARRRAQNAQLIIVNHALFFADLALRKHGSNIIPDYDYVVLDEAHTLEKVASDHFGTSITERQVLSLLRALYNRRTQRGFLATCHAESTAEAVSSTAQIAKQLFSNLVDWQQRHGRPNGRWLSPPEVENTLSPALRGLRDKLGQLRNQLTDEDALFELSSYMERCCALADVLEEFLEHEREGHVYWIEMRGDTPRATSLHARPLDVAEEMRQFLFNAVDAVVMTSATIAVQSDTQFEYFRRRLGIEECSSLTLDSPYDYQRQVDLHIESALPSPNETQQFIPLAADVIAHHVKQSAGRSLVLFTSYRSMDEFADCLADRFEHMHLNLLVQGRGLNRSTMLEHLRQGNGTVIFGTDSFWQGIDVRGEALQNVIIVKLPFASPGEPLVEARIEAINSSGGNAFRDYQLPQAILKFRQGVGRLIRSKTDHGKVVVLDSRIVRKSYGREFLASLPRCNVIINS